jgi:hypothetical protein
MKGIHGLPFFEEGTVTEMCSLLHGLDLPEREQVIINYHIMLLLQAQHIVQSLLLHTSPVSRKKKKEERHVTAASPEIHKKEGYIYMHVVYMCPVSFSDFSTQFKEHLESCHDACAITLPKTKEVNR